MSHIHLREADKLEIAVIVDNYSDLLLADSETAKRLRTLPPGAPMAEHGLSLLIKVTRGTETHTVLMDTGISGKCLQNNVDALQGSMGVMLGTVTVDINDVEAVVLSHGHFDHFGGLSDFFKATGKKMPVIVHPGAFVQRRVKRAPDFFMDMPTLDVSSMEKMGATVDMRRDPSTLASDLILVSGEVARTTDFEKGSPSLEANIDGTWMADPFFDDQALAVRVKNKGLVVIGGCSHAGIVNTVKHIRKTTGMDNIHAVLGGFHLSGSDTALVAATVSEIKKIQPDFIIPMHCTGWEATNRFSSEMPGQFVLNSVGTTYLFGV